MRLEPGEYSASLSEPHVLPPIDSRHAPLILVVRVRAVHQQVVHDVGLVVVGGVEKAGPTGLPNNIPVKTGRKKSDGFM